MRASPSPRFIVGIDLGTTHTVAAFVDLEAPLPRSPQTFAIEQWVAAGEVQPLPLLPSVRYHPAEGELDTPSAIVGRWALRLGAQVPGRLVASAKSWLSHAAVDRTAPILPWGATEDVPRISPVEASASYLQHLTTAWDRTYPKHPLAEQDVVLTVPASFDEGARLLTLEAARLAGLERLRLLEEPQAAFYDWMSRHEASFAERLQGSTLILIVDVGGGTTDLTLIRFEERERGPRLNRVAVGDHLMLGGDNMDLAVARLVESELTSGQRLSTERLHQLVQQCRLAKEKLLQADPPSSAEVTVLGSGSKLVGGTVGTHLARTDVAATVLDGFFPRVELSDRPAKRRSAVVEFGLPFVADPAVTRHVASFLADHGSVVPDAVLLNGGVFRAPAISNRLLETVTHWRGRRPQVLDNPAPELAVARGAVAYGLARRGEGLRIGGGSPRAYFLVVPDDTIARCGVCILPRGAEEGEEHRLTDPKFLLRVGEPVRFELASSTHDARNPRPGDLVELDESDYVDLPPVAAILDQEQKEEVPVQVASGLTEVGTLELGCVATEAPRRRWKLEFQLRGARDTAPRIGRVGQLHPRFAEATAQIQRLYGRRSQDVKPRDVKRLRASLERVVGKRADWTTPLLRELFAVLLAGAKRRRRSPAHERVWLNLAGYTLRPGFGYPLDEWRVSELYKLFADGIEFMPETQNQAEWWILWRRVAGGLPADAQARVLDAVEWHLLPPSSRPRARPSGPRWTPHDDMVRLAGSLERVAAERKARVGEGLIARLQSGDAPTPLWWAVGRLGARAPLYGSAHQVVARTAAEQWLETCLAEDWERSEYVPFAATLLARRTGDRERDVDDNLRERVVAKLGSLDTPPSWRRMVQEIAVLESADEQRIFGESLPPGLRLAKPAKTPKEIDFRGPGTVQ